MFQAYRRVMEVLSWMVVGAMIVQTPLAAGETSAGTAEYPIWTKEMVELKPDQIREALGQRLRSELRHTEVLDLVVALTWAGEYDKAIEVATARLPMTDDRKELSSLYACIGTVEALMAGEARNRAGSLSWWNRMTNWGEREKLEEGSRAHQRKAMQAVREACRIDSANGKLAALYAGLARNLGDDLELRAAEDFFKRADAEREGVEVCDPVTGTIIVVALVAGTFTIVTLATPRENRAEAIKHLAGLASLATAAVVTIRVVTE